MPGRSPTAALHQISAVDAKEHEKAAGPQPARGWDPGHSDTSWRLVPTWGGGAAGRQAPALTQTVSPPASGTGL